MPLPYTDRLLNPFVQFSPINSHTEFCNNNGNNNALKLPLRRPMPFRAFVIVENIRRICLLNSTADFGEKLGYASNIS